MEWRPSLHLGIVGIEKGAFESPLTKFANFTYIYITQLTGAVERTAPLQRGKTPTSESLGYDTKQSDGEVPVMLEI